jgi:hypothetical protein
MTAVDQIVQNAKKNACQGRPSTYDEITARDMIMMPQFAAAHPRKERLGPVGAGVVDAVSLLVVDTNGGNL